MKCQVSETYIYFIERNVNRIKVCGKRMFYLLRLCVLTLSIISSNSVIIFKSVLEF